ncbi:patatin-like phospholipase family protein [Pseudoalteromonas fuliginea]|uniref:patatin-like phospholipase family protein n=1 Tax=Pseudoalteromonas fuliginea TaxID=1872678 RepID=UPI0031700DCA
MNKLLIMLVFGALLSACSGIRSVPYPTHFETLDKNAVNFIREVPPVNLNNYAPQQNRASQLMQDRDILVSISGGGARAAAFTLGVLAELENLGQWTELKNTNNALLEIDYFSTVSGGGWGASAYLADVVQLNSSSYSLNTRLPVIERKFLDFSEDNDSCLSRGIEKNITTGVTLGDINAKHGEHVSIPYLFVNTTIESNQSPFVVSREHVKYYRVDHFYACGDDIKYEVSDDVDSLPVSYAVATSGSVPGFHYSSASTTICSDQKLSLSSFCSKGKNDLSQLILIDGGLYDNYGFQTALEILNSAPKDHTKTLIVIDTNADTEIPFTNDRERWNIGVGISSLKKAGFPSKTSSFNRLFNLTAQSMGIKPLVLDFYSAVLSEDELQKVKDLGMLNGLDLLSAHAANQTNCFAEDGTYLDDVSERQEFRSEDCILNNYYRSGLIGKTTYKFDDYYFTLLEQLGKFVVRVNAQKIYAALYE